ncbi:uncharacterized protein LOC143238826 [Tachypleus tridentatus]|uniref:uncharacterized protein LOC143238826 n=1 Tax=Tachypleus tridentatus TaxID=6853 RepID=UPI003FD4E806
MALYLQVFIILLLKDLQQLLGVHLKVLDIPSPTTLGQSIELTCSYELDGDQLYSVKWYKDNTEFFRYLPLDWPPGQFLPLPGVRVDLSKSGKDTVYLNHVTLETAGVYRCEVSAEAPSFQTVEASKEMKVTVFPTEGPIINGARPEYIVGDTVNINCTSAKSKPAAKIRWYINDEIVGPDYKTTSSITLHDDGLEASTLGLRFVVTENHLRNGNMKLRCIATVFQAVELGNEVTLFARQQKASGLRISKTLNQVDESAGVIVSSTKWSKLPFMLLFMVLYHCSVLSSYVQPV